MSTNSRSASIQAYTALAAMMFSDPTLQVPRRGNFEVVSDPERLKKKPTKPYVYKRGGKKKKGK